MPTKTKKELLHDIKRLEVEIGTSRIQITNLLNALEILNLEILARAKQGLSTTSEHPIMEKIYKIKNLIPGIEERLSTISEEQKRIFTQIHSS